MWERGDATGSKRLSFFLYPTKVNRWLYCCHCENHYDVVSSHMEWDILAKLSKLSRCWLEEGAVCSKHREQHMQRHKKQNSVMQSRNWNKFSLIWAYWGTGQSWQNKLDKQGPDHRGPYISFFLGMILFEQWRAFLRSLSISCAWKTHLKVKCSPKYKRWSIFGACWRFFGTCQ